MSKEGLIIELTRIFNNESLTETMDDKATDMGAVIYDEVITGEISGVSLIKNATNTTKIETEKNIGENIIRFTTSSVQEAQIDANGIKLKSGADINEFSVDGTLGGDSDDAVPTEKAVKAYVDNLSSVYAPIDKGVTNGDSHDHAGGDGGTINHSSLNDDEITKHRIINDAGTSSTELWSANKINTEISSISAITTDNIIVVDPNIAAVAGRNYQTWSDADTYIQTQSPSNTDRWGIKIYGTNNENITVRNFVHIIGDGRTTRLTGTINVTSYDASQYDSCSIFYCIITDLSVNKADGILWLEGCYIESGTITSILYLICMNCTFYGSGVDLSAATGIRVGSSFIVTGVFPANTVIGYSSLLNPDIYGGIFENCTIGDSALGTTDIYSGNYTFNNCVIYDNITLTASEGVVVKCNNCSFNSVTITINSGNTLITGGSIEGLTVIENSGTWTKVDGEFKDLNVTGEFTFGSDSAGELYSSNDDIYFKNVIQDKDIIFQVNDGGVDTEIFRLDGNISSFVFPNNKTLRWQDTGGTNRTVLYMDVANNINLYQAAAAHINIQNASQDKDIIFQVNDGGVNTEVMRVLGIDSTMHTKGALFVEEIKSGATQVAAGAATDELWKTSSHATLPDNVIMIGV